MVTELFTGIHVLKSTTLYYFHLAWLCLFGIVVLFPKSMVTRLLEAIHLPAPDDDQSDDSNEGCEEEEEEEDDERDGNDDDIEEVIDVHVENGSNAFNGGEEADDEREENNNGESSSTVSTISQTWENQALAICEQELGAEKFHKRLSKYEKLPSAGFGSKTRLSIEESKVKKTVIGNAPFFRHYNASGAVGYALVLNNPDIPKNDFFIPGRRFRLRVRYSNLRSEDDACACQREAAIKFADQNEDGPMDLVMLTGRMALARNINTFLDIIRLKKDPDVKQMCYRDPHYYAALVDSLRRTPRSFTSLHYYSQVVYHFLPKDRKPRLMRFRLLPAEGVEETGLPDEIDQRSPWLQQRRSGEMKPQSYLRKELLQRLECEPIKNILQVQIRDVPEGGGDQTHWNPQKMWPEDEFPWIDLAEIKLTTPLTTNALRRTYYNVTDKPSCLKFPAPASVHCYRSYNRAWSIVHTTMEIKRIGHPLYSVTDMDTIRRGYKQAKVMRIVGLCAGLKKEARPQVEVYVALTGSKGRSSAKRLDDFLEKSPHDPCLEYFKVFTEPIGKVLAVTVAVRHRHLTDEWYLRYITVSDANRLYESYFPCHSTVMSKITLRPGEVSLPHHLCHEVLRQERLLELRDRQIDYNWQAVHGLPSQIKGTKLKDIPANEQMKGEKYSTISWDIDGALAEILRPILQSLNPQQPFSLARHPANEAHLKRRKPTSPEQALAQKNARRRWIKIKHAIHFLSRVKLPDGPQGEMCRQVQEDSDFARSFLMGSNPVMIRKCTSIPDNFPVMEGYSQIKHYMDRGIDLPEEAQAGHVYLADYKILDELPCVHNDADHRYLAAPIALFYVKASGDFIPLAIQLGQIPGPHNPVYMPRDKGEAWLLAKLWVRSADFHYQFVISHLLKCHMLIEPFAITTSRHLSSSHPVYKLLQPHLKTTIVTNALIRQHIIKKGTAMDKWTSLGSDGFKVLAKRCYKLLTFDCLDLPKEIASREVDDVDSLPHYLYRDDAMRLWNAISKYCFSVVTLFYKTNDDITGDTELQTWMQEVVEKGFREHVVERDVPLGLCDRLSSICDLVELCTKLIFASTVQHAATHAEALDLYGHMPLVPAMMRQPPPTSKAHANKECIIKTLPTEQSAEAYYGSLAFVMQLCKPDNNPLGNSAETYFVEADAQAMKQAFRDELKNIAAHIQARNKSIEPIRYEALLPEKIPNNYEIIPFVPNTDISADALDEMGRLKPGVKGVNLGNPSIPLMTLPICMQFARNMGGRSFLGRQMSQNAFSSAMKGVGMDRGLNMPMQATDKGMNMKNMNMMNMMY